MGMCVNLSNSLNLTKRILKLPVQFAFFFLLKNIKQNKTKQSKKSKQTKKKNTQQQTLIDKINSMGITRWKGGGGR